jgi:hypothetical protein
MKIPPPIFSVIITRIINRFEVELSHVEPKLKPMGPFSHATILRSID